jgi:hypothetical protein
VGLRADPDGGPGMTAADHITNALAIICAVRLTVALWFV